jgi:hypothetical protein
VSPNKELKLTKPGKLRRVGPGGCPPGPPTDPDVQDYCIRLVSDTD